MTSHVKSACICLLITFYTCVNLSAAPLSDIEVQGVNFSIQKLEESAKAFENRLYKFNDIPEQLKNWQFTRVKGGVRNFMQFTAPTDGTAYITVSCQCTNILDKEWNPTEYSFTYSTGNPTKMTVYTRECRKNELVKLPQGGFTGGMLIAPQLKKGKTLSIMYPPPPGTIISASPNPENTYIGSPSIVILPNGNYVASHDWFGSGCTPATTEVFTSANRGLTWKPLATLNGQYWSTLFMHKGDLYIMGTAKPYGNAVIRRSKDNGRTWTTPSDSSSGLLIEGSYHCAPVPVLVHNGRIWRAIEEQTTDKSDGWGWGRWFCALMMSAPVNSDLLKAENWTTSNRLQFKTAWRNTTPKTGWLEGNAVAAPDGKVYDILRFEDKEDDLAAVTSISEDGRTISFNPETGIIPMFGGKHKFTIRYDTKTGRYWSLVNKQTNPKAVRNVLALTSSSNLKTWKCEMTVLMHHDRNDHGFQYIDWQFDGNDIILASRTAWGNAHNMHDANFLTFHRIKDFRTAEKRAVE